MPKPELPHGAPAVAHSASQRPVLIYRQISLSLAAFEHLKAWQRRLELVRRRPLTNGEVLDALILAVPLP